MALTPNNSPNNYIWPSWVCIEFIFSSFNQYLSHDYVASNSTGSNYVAGALISAIFKCGLLDDDLHIASPDWFDSWKYFRSFPFRCAYSAALWDTCLAILTPSHSVPTRSCYFFEMLVWLYLWLLIPPLITISELLDYVFSFSSLLLTKISYMFLWLPNLTEVTI